MSETLREKVTTAAEKMGYGDLKDIGVLCVIADHVDALAARVDGTIIDGSQRLGGVEMTVNRHDAEHWRFRDRVMRLEYLTAGLDGRIDANQDAEGRRAEEIKQELGELSERLACLECALKRLDPRADIEHHARRIAKLEEHKRIWIDLAIPKRVGRLETALSCLASVDVDAEQLQKPAECVDCGPAPMPDLVTEPMGRDLGDAAEGMDVEDETSADAFLAEENRNLRKAGCALAEAALRVVRTYDGIHRLALAVAGWSTVIGNEGSRDAIHHDRQDAEGEPSRPWREAALHVMAKIRVGILDHVTGGDDYDPVAIIEAAIEHAVWDTIVHKNREAGSIAKERDGLKVKLESTCQLAGERNAKIQKLKGELKLARESRSDWKDDAVRYGKERDALQAEVAQLKDDLEQCEEDEQSRVDELHRALYPDGGDVDWNAHITEVRRLKADKLHVVHLTREELEEALHTTGWATSSACVQKTVEHILALQDKHVEEANHAQD